MFDKIDWDAPPNPVRGGACPVRRSDQVSEVGHRSTRVATAETRDAWTKACKDHEEIELAGWWS